MNAAKPEIEAAAFRFLNIAAYKFVPLTQLKERRQRLLSIAKPLDLSGSILLSPEGINLFVAGEPDKVDILLAELQSWPELEGLTPKISGSEHMSFRRLHVRIKKEIIAFGVEGIEPAKYTSKRVSPRELKRWLDGERRVTLLDTRNDYEVKVGTFESAISIGLEHFRDFPAAAHALDPQLKEQTVVVFCTGGIRCEKAGPYLERIGFKQVFQLDGGILKYFEECGGAYFNGECFVFDRRTGLDPALHPNGWTQCFACRAPLSAEDQAHPTFVEGISCRYCFKTPPEQMAQIVARRNAKVREIIDPLPGSVARDHFRPIHVPGHCDGLRLIDTLCRVVKHISEEDWRGRCERGFILDADGLPASPERIVRAGECYRHCFADVVEPDVDMRIEVLHEDDALIVIHKPAPLPMHTGGRFHRNTLKYVLDALYRPQKLRPAHRLDANTTGVLVIARTQYIAGKIQPQFARGDVEKVYLVRVQGHPANDAFSCAAPISVASAEIGSRFIDHANGLAAHTDFRVLDRLADGTALLEARPRTGRTNQIRVHLWHLGFPVCGDRSYLAGGIIGDTQTLAVDDPPLCLHAWRLAFMHPLRKERVTFTAPAPKWAANSAVRDRVAFSGDGVRGSTSTRASSH